MNCPIFLWRIYKYIVHLFTGRSEIERICYDAELKSLDRLKLIQISVNSSKQLHHIEKQMRSEFDPGDVAIKIVEVKNFNQELLAFDSMILPNLISALEPISSFQGLKRSIENKQKIPYDNSNLHHEASLERLWDALLPDVRRSARLSKEWGTLGFQGMDPATDFRGMGILGLDNLIYLSTKHSNEAREILKNSNSKCCYPFAITGINITALVLNLIDKPHFKIYFFKNGSTLDQFNELYSLVFISFDRFYQSKKPKSIMEFNTIKKEFEIKISKDSDLVSLLRY
ncbi:hypothetical protein RB653_005479 [Dictyostelium firmibasis]|uniref:ELMO domain-containing protein n=1 Tax=Dictyostelium firmibasis TaxID=79012 RepID=A0AAN7UCP3_9MYCE